MSFAGYASPRWRPALVQGGDCWRQAWESWSNSTNDGAISKRGQRSVVLRRSSSSPGCATSVTASPYRQSRWLARVRSASVSDAILRAAALVLLLAVAACARPTGDFGRAQPGLLHDGIMPAIGSTRAQLAEEPVSHFNIADEEREMRDRVWRFLVAPHAHDWFYDTVVELQRTRIAGTVDHRFEPARYYRWLRQTGFSSSTTRYRAVADHIVADLATVPETFRAICAV